MKVYMAVVQCRTGRCLGRIRAFRSSRGKADVGNSSSFEIIGRFYVCLGGRPWGVRVASRISFSPYSLPFVCLHWVVKCRFIRWLDGIKE